MTWRLARSLTTLFAEVNTAAPSRSKASDGTIGDSAHSSRASDHNVNAAGVVRAADITHDPDDGCDANDIANAVAGLLGKHPALKSGAYVIWNWRIISADRIGEGWRRYTGSNGHTKHAHVSVATSATGYDSTAPWGIYQEADDMYSDDDRARDQRIEDMLKSQMAGDRTFRENNRTRHQQLLRKIAAEPDAAKRKAMADEADSA